MVTAQHGLCALCEKPPSVGRYLDVDHDHQTGEIRALLCRHCNSALGLYDEDPGLLRRAATYLERFRKAVSE